jgi:hypothetical protein
LAPSSLTAAWLLAVYMLDLLNEIAVARQLGIASGITRPFLACFP